MRLGSSHRPSNRAASSADEMGHLLDHAQPAEERAVLLVSKSTDVLAIVGLSAC